MYLHFLTILKCFQIILGYPVYDIIYIFVDKRISDVPVNVLPSKSLYKLIQFHVSSSYLLHRQEENVDTLLERYTGYCQTHVYTNQCLDCSNLSRVSFFILVQIDMFLHFSFQVIFDLY